MKENKLIAEFMGMKYSDKRSFNNGEWTHSIESLNKFKTSWDWLMPVVEKCFQEEGNHYVLNDALITINIEEVYKAVVEFIKQLNKES
jgi:ribulose bisphosphate carboxylase small subunit